MNTVNFSKITSREKGYLIGLYIGDGNIFEQNLNGIYRLRYFLGLNEKLIQEKIIKILSKLHKNMNIRRYTRDNTCIIEVHSKQLINFIKNTCTKDGIKKMKVPLEFKKGVIEGLIDSDGYVQRNYVEITTSNNKLKENIINMLIDFHLKINVRNFVSPISKRVGWRIGFSLKDYIFKPLKWVSVPQTAE